MEAAAMKAALFYGWLVPCVLLFMASLFQFITMRCKNVHVRPMVKNGKSMMASGFALGALWYLYRLSNPDYEFNFPLGGFAFALVGLGSIVANADRFIRGQEDARATQTSNIYDVSNYTGPERRDRSLRGKMRRLLYDIATPRSGL